MLPWKAPFQPEKQFLEQEPADRKDGMDGPAFSLDQNYPFFPLKSGNVRGHKDTIR